ncbi:uncharacterized protein EI90DRAFT_3071222 [Cantharellus anzutake]|uniref:uncharacterized protein n=1 Tax=Cantharellus anzutake TaxID=1750568 RepID=UPI001904C2BA|nr:uncharacterized protein EI90DRAFT_3071222 [Cantharellus anzutake]KAF8326030.1 hypothetical protein EI90DRAFT_3071222 [Cantharellus anzutake]
MAILLDSWETPRRTNSCPTGSSSHPQYLSTTSTSPVPNYHPRASRIWLGLNHQYLDSSGLQHVI